MDAHKLTAPLLYDRLRHHYQADLPFNRLLGMTVLAVDAERARMAFDMREDLIGNSFQRTLHGGVISAVLDAVGGLTASGSLVARAVDQPVEEIPTLFARVGTIDLRVDYLRPGRGRRFVANGRIMRAGRKVAVVRMEMHNQDELLVAVGTGTYMIG